MFSNRITSSAMCFAAACGVSLAIAGRAAAQGLRTQHVVTTSFAIEAAEAALGNCKEKGWNVSIVIVDPNGDVIVSLRDDHAGYHTLEIARRKAFTAAVSGTATAIWGANVAAGRRPPDPNLVYVEPLLLAPGGVPIIADGETVGAIGVSGGTGPTADSDCANAGIAKISARLK
jgi:uncharacterized protein GlcG (DUF336 family)